MAPTVNATLVAVPRYQRMSAYVDPSNFYVNHLPSTREGRKERFCPLWPPTAAALRFLIVEVGLQGDSRERLFRNRRGEPLTRFGVRHILRTYAQRAEASCAEPRAKARAPPHDASHRGGPSPTGRR